MKIPTITGVIDRRILANYRVDPQVLQAVLPEPFRPKVVGGFGIAGICLIRLREIRLQRFPRWMGVKSENAAHRIAVAWDDKGGVREGVYIPRRDTSSCLSSLVGGRVFPGEHHHANFQVEESADDYDVAFRSRDGRAGLRIKARRTSDFPASSVFPSLKEASDFFEAGALGYSKTARDGVYDGLELCTRTWEVESLDVSHMESDFFEDLARFPAGSVEFDCALLMTAIDHTWQAREPLCRS